MRISGIILHNIFYQYGERERSMVLYQVIDRSNCNAFIDIKPLKILKKSGPSIKLCPIHMKHYTICTDFIRVKRLSTFTKIPIIIYPHVNVRVLPCNFQ